MGFIAQIIGGILAIFVLFALWEWALFKRVFDDPMKGKVASVVAAYLSGSALAGFGRADGGPYYWGAFLDYFIPALIVSFFAIRRGMQLREEVPDRAALEDTFS